MGASTVTPVVLCYYPLLATSSQVGNAVASAYYRLDPHTYIHVSQMNTQICEFQNVFVSFIQTDAAGRKIPLLKEHAGFCRESV
jgi:hypothetical protein